jgi:hypothetical protein
MNNSKCAPQVFEEKVVKKLNSAWLENCSKARLKLKHDLVV